MVKVGVTRTGCVEVIVNVDVGGIEVLVLVIVEVTVNVVVGVSVAVEVDVAVGGRVGTVWKLNPPQTTFCGMNKIIIITPIRENNLKVNFLFISHLPEKIDELVVECA